MSEPAALQIDMLKPHVRAIFDEVRRVGPEGCRAARYEVEARFREESKHATHDKGSLGCAGLHVLAAVAMQIYMDVSGQDGAVDAYVEALIAQQAADDCEAAV